MYEGRKRTPIPDPEVERRSRGSGPVITYKLTPEELEEYRRKTGYKPKEEETMITIDKERYLKMRLQGMGRTQIMRGHFKNSTAFYDQLKAWGIKEKDAEDRELELMGPDPTGFEGPKLAKESAEESKTAPESQDPNAELVSKIEQLIKEHGVESSTTNKIKKIRIWALDRGLDTADPAKQMLKLGEEYGELCQGMAKGNNDQIIDSIGDMFIVLVVLSLQLGIDIEDCIDRAYDEIKDRKGQMINGVFVKESDIGA